MKNTKKIMMQYNMTILVLVFFSFGCTTPIPVYINKNEKACIIDDAYAAVDFWNDELGIHALELKKMEKLKNPIGSWSIYIKKDIKTVGNKTLNGRTSGHLLRKKIEIRDALHGDNDEYNHCHFGMMNTMAHEFGHAFGNIHLSSGGKKENIMYDKGRTPRGWKTTKKQRRRAKIIMRLYHQKLGVRN